VKKMLATIPRAPPIGSKALLPDRSFIGWFRRYNSEARKEIIIHKVKENETLRQLKEAFRKLEYPGDAGKCYVSAVSLIRNIKHSSKDVTNFSIALVEFQHEEVFSTKAGLFLSALINESNGKNFTVITEHLEKPIDWLGYENTKNIIVQGNVGDCVGEDMKCGKITIQGNAREDVGYRMTGGSIYVGGKYTSLSDYIYGGNVYHKGKLIVKDGKTL